MLYCDRHGYYHPGTNRVGTNAAGAGVVTAWDVCPTCEDESARAMLGCLGWLAAGAVAIVVVLFGSFAAFALLFGASTPAEEGDRSNRVAGSGTFDPWDATASVHRGRDGESFIFECPGGGDVQRVFGAGPYTDDSPVCSAGVHAGAITAANGGRVVIDILPGQDAYEGVDANGVTSSSWGEWPGSFSVQVP